MKLTTPELRDYDPVFPGENWFFYWKTSPSLWESKLSIYNGASPIFVPLNWGFHSEHQDQYDFGNYRPETDLKRLFEIATNLGREMILVVPVSPAPFLPNGGIPSYLAKTMSLSSEGIALSVLDNENRLNKIYSFFEPKVFQAYRKFVWNVGQYLSQNGIQCEVIGANYGYLKDQHFISYLEDHSIAFEQGFNRYIKQLQQSDPGEVKSLLDNPAHEVVYKKNFFHLIENLYQEAASESLAASWGKVIKFSVLGGAPEDVFSRSSELWDHEANFFTPMMEIVVNNIMPSSFLLPPYLKKGTLEKSLKDLVNATYLKAQLSNTLYENDERLSFLPLVFFEIYTPNIHTFREDDLVEKIGLSNFFNNYYQGTYRYQYSEVVVNGDEDEIHKVYFLFGRFMTDETFTSLLKLFMNGGKIFLDASKLDDRFKKKLNLFINENNIKTESLNFLTNIVKADLGEGVLLLYDSAELQKNSLMKKTDFWQKIIKHLNLKHLKVQHDDELYYFWKSRNSNTYELDYEEIRRISFYNPTSYKKKAQVITSSNFAFLKTIDQYHGEIKSTPVGIDVVLLPGGSVSLDFGYYE